MIMVQGLRIISAVAKYETKLLVRSWFFKIFSILSLLVAPIYGAVLLFDESQISSAIKSVVPYSLLLIMNVGQAIVSIFLSSEYLKRDKQLDTSEVFYTRPLSNAEYLLGKMWATLRVFFVLDFMILAVALLMSMIKMGFDLDYLSYIWYFLLLCVPTLVFITGLSTTLILIVKNQALTLVLLLAYIGVTLFYIDDIYYYLFDYIGFNLPMLKSTITGFGNISALITHRACYLLLGIGLILCSISLFRRLPNSRYSLLPWRIAACVFLLSGFYSGYRHVSRYTGNEKYRNEIIALNNLHVYDPKMEVDTCLLEVIQNDDVLTVTASMIVKPVQMSDKFTFCLNPGFSVNSVKSNGKDIEYERNEHILILDFGRQVDISEMMELRVEYSGKVDERICYLDIPKEMLLENVKVLSLLNVCKQYAFQSSKYVMLTPESYWYPRPGVSYSDESPDWQQSYFTNFRTIITPNKGLTAISQGQRIVSADSSFFSYSSRYPLQSVSLFIGDYISKSIELDNTLYSVWELDGYDDGFSEFDSIRDTIPAIIRDVRTRYESQTGLTYPFDRFSIVEVPAHFVTYSRAWTKSQEVLQPEMALIPERGYFNRQFDFVKQMKQYQLSNKYSQRQMSDNELRASMLMGAIGFMESTRDFKYKGGRNGTYSLTTTANPYYVFPLMYNFRYNVYSSSLPVANRLIEVFIQDNRNTNDSWLRETNGMTDDEKALLLLQKYNFNELLSDSKRRDILDNIIGLKAQYLFSEAQQKMGVDSFKDSLYNIIKANDFSNLSFEYLMKQMGDISGSDILSSIKKYGEKMQLAEFSIGIPIVTNIVNEKEDIYQAEITIDNISDVPGYVRLELQFYNGGGESVSGEEKPKKWLVRLEPHQAKRIVSLWNTPPNEFLVNTLISSNLPEVINAIAGSTAKASVKTPEGEYVVPEGKMFADNEIIVDNEDDSLFVLSKPAQTGLLTKWVDRANKDEEFKYSAYSMWRAPYKWTPVTDGRCFGLSVRSAYLIGSGDGSQYAEWHVPVKDAGTYEVYYFVRKPEDVNRGFVVRRNYQGKRAEQAYNFEIKQFDVSESTSLNIQRAEDGWNQLGTFRFAADTVIVKLNNKAGLNTVTADAVKFVKK